MVTVMRSVMSRTRHDLVPDADFGRYHKQEFEQVTRAASAHVLRGSAKAEMNSERLLHGTNVALGQVIHMDVVLACVCCL